ncbi:MAG: magnesium transporter [Micropepsaceae bacterium]
MTKPVLEQHKTTPMEMRDVTSPAFLRAVLNTLDAGEAAALKRLMEPLHPADIASLLGAIDASDRRALITALGTDIDPEVLSEVDENLRAELIRTLGVKTVAGAVSELDVEDAAYVLEDLADSDKREVLSQVPFEERLQVVDALLFPEGSAGRVMHREFVAMPGHLTVGEALSRLSSDDTPEDFLEIYIVNDSQKPVGVVPLNRLVRASSSTTLSDIAATDLTLIPATADHKTLAYLFEHYHLNSAPVTGEDGKLVGVLSADSVVELMQDMHKTEVLALGGVADEETLSASTAKTTWLRFSWLFVNLLTAVIASIFIGFFEKSLGSIVALAILMPIVASMGGNAGTQTLTVVVRSLATKELNRANVWRVINREMLIGGFNGIGFAFLAAGITWVWFSNLALSGVIAAAMVINLIAAAAAGILVPLAFNRAGVDPAVSSPVFVTTVTDVVGFVSFLGLATWLLLN